MSSPPTMEQLTGLDDRAIVHDALEQPVHGLAVEAFRALYDDARAAGFELRIASGYRGFQRQLSIWCAKAEGHRPLLDSGGKPLEPRELDDWQRARAILRWSALPGASRHHWGTDLDLYDAAAVPADYRLQLSPAEVAEDGPFGPLHRWLDERIAVGRSHGFFRPYDVDRGGIAPERWHLSYAPLAADFQRALDREGLYRFLDEQQLPLWRAVASHWPEVYDRFIDVPLSRYPVIP